MRPIINFLIILIIAQPAGVDIVGPLTQSSIELRSEFVCKIRSELGLRSWVRVKARDFGGSGKESLVLCSTKLVMIFVNYTGPYPYYFSVKYYVVYYSRALIPNSIFNIVF